MWYGHTCDHSAPCMYFLSGSEKQVLPCKYFSKKGDDKLGRLADASYVLNISKSLGFKNVKCQV